MAQVNPLTRELLVKLVYYGPGLGGKTTSLQHIHRSSAAETRGQLVSLATPVDRTLYFDFLPLRARSVRGHQVRLQLFTVPGQVYFNATRKLVLTGADGVVFVADSQPQRQDANLESLENLAANLLEQGRRLDEIPLVFEFNKRDLPNLQSIETMERTLNPGGRPVFPTVATTGQGVLEALDRLVEDVLADLERRGALGPSPPPPDAASVVLSLEPEQGIGSQIGELVADAEGAAWRSSVEKAFRHATRPSYLPEEAVALREEPSFPTRTSVPAPFRASPGGPSWAVFFDDREPVERIEADIVAGRYVDAIVRCEKLVGRLLEDAGRKAGIVGPEPALLAPWLGVPAARWLGYRRVAQRARDGGPLDVRDALLCFAMLIELRLALREA